MDRRTFLEACGALALCAAGCTNSERTPADNLEREIKFWPETGKRAPEFPDSTQLISGAPIRLNQFKGDVVLLDFWSAQNASPENRRAVSGLSEQYKGNKDFHVIGVMLDEDKKKAVPFVKSLSQRPTQVCNGNGWKDQIAQRYHVKSAPTFVLVDRNGVVRSGSFSPKNLSENVGKLLAEPRSEKSFEMDPVEIPLKMPSENVYRPHVGFKAPPIKGKTLEGELITPENLSGKVVVLDFWATWCAPCKEQTPGFKQMYFNHRLDSNFELIGVSLDKSILQLSLSVDKEKIPYKQICDQKAWEGELVKHYGVNSVPRNYLIDKNGIIRVKNMHPSDLGFAVRALLADKPLPDFVPKGSYKSESGTSPELEYGLELFAKYSLPGWGPGMLKELKQKPVDALKPSELEFVGGYDLWRMARRYEELKASP